MSQISMVVAINSIAPLLFSRHFRRFKGLEPANLILHSYDQGFHLIT